MLLEKELGFIEQSYYEASVTRPPACPPLECGEAADVCIIGAGYAGLSAALELAEAGMRVVVLEAQRIGWGASGRNGGQVLAGFGSDGECTIEKQLTAIDARRAWDITVEAIALVKERIARLAIDCEFQPGYLMLAPSERRARSLRRWADNVERAYGYPLQWLDRGDLVHWVASSRYAAAVHDAESGHLHPLKYCLGLGLAAQAAGAIIHEHSAACLVQRGDPATIITPQGSVHAKFVLLAGNVYLDEYGAAIAPELTGRIMPVGTYIVATESMEEDRAQQLIPSRCCASDTNHVLDYFRVTTDRRLVFGGGESYSGNTPRDLATRMRKRLANVFPQAADLSTPYAWGGFVDLSFNMAPDFGRVTPNIYYLQGFSGHGLAMSGMAGKLAAEAIRGHAERFDIFSRIKHRRFPGGRSLRVPALVLGMLYYRMMDALQG